MATAAAACASFIPPSTSSSSFSLSSPHSNFLSLPCCRHIRRSSSSLRVSATVSAPLPEVQTGDNANHLVSSILSKVTESDRGVKLTRDEHKEVGEIAEELQQYCVDSPVTCSLIFGEWDVVYCSNPTSPGGLYRTGIGRFIFKTKEMIQVVEAPDTIRNKVSFSVFGFLDGKVSLKGKLIALDKKWIKVCFEPPELNVGGFEFQYGGESEVKLQITYIDEKLRLGKGSRGSVFVFRRSA